MKINKIVLENIRSYTNEEIVFPDGSTILSGDIGSGKTSVLLAIEFALFGLQPGQKGSGLLRNGAEEGKIILEMEVDGENIVIERRLKKGKTVNQSFASINGEERSVTEIKNKVLELLNYPKEFAKKTNLLYRFTVYTPQEEMKQIILENAETRLDTLRHIFGIDKYKRIKENTELFTANLRENIRELEGQIQDLEIIKKRVDEKNSNLASMNNNLVLLKDELKNRKAERVLAEEEIKSVEEKIKQKQSYERELEKTRIVLAGKNESLNELEKEKQKLQASIQETLKLIESSQTSEKLSENIMSLKNDIAKTKAFQSIKENELKELELKMREKQKLEQETDTLKLKIKIKNQAVSDLEKEREKLLSQINEFSKISFSIKDIEILETSLKANELSINTKNQSYLEILARINNFNSRINELSNNKKDLPKLVNCPTCFQEVKEDYKNNILRKFEDDLFQLKKQVVSSQIERDSLVKELEILKQNSLTFKKELSEKEKLKIKLEDIKEKQKRVTDIEQQKKNLNQEIEDFNKNIEKSSHSIMLIGKLDVDEKKKELQLLLSSEREKESLINNFQREIDKQANHKLNIREKEQRVTEIGVKKNELIKDAAILEIGIKQLEESISMLKKYDLVYEQKKKELKSSLENERKKELEIASCEKEIEVTLVVIKELKNDIESKESIKLKLIKNQELEDWLSNSFLNIMSFTEKNIMLTLREEFSKLFNEWFNVLVPENFSVRLDEDFTPIIEQQDFQLDYAYLSGGERTAIALAYRLALNQVINSLLSKIKTRSIVILDEPTDGFSEQQLDKMRDVLSQLKAEQLIIVSHESKIESFVENIIKFKKTDGITKALV